MPKRKPKASRTHSKRQKKVISPEEEARSRRLLFSATRFLTNHDKLTLFTEFSIPIPRVLGLISRNIFPIPRLSIKTTESELQGIAEALAQAIQSSAHLRSISVDSIPTRAFELVQGTTYDFTQVICQALAASGTVESATFKNYTCSSVRALDWAAAIRKSPSLQKISFISDSRNSSSVQSLSPEAADSLMQAVSEAKSLYSVSLVGQGLDGETTKRIAKALDYENAVAHLNLSRNSIKDEGVVSISNAIKTCPKLTQLNISTNGIGKYGAGQLAEAIDYGRNMRSLDISGNPIENAGGEALLGAIAKCHSMISINMSQTGITGAALRGLPLVARQNRLERLDLSLNRIEDSGGRAVATLLSESESLRYLNLSSNLLTDKFALCLAKVLSESRLTLSELNVGFNKMTQEGLTALSLAVIEGRTVKEFVVEYNKARDAEIEELRDLFVGTDVTVEFGGNIEDDD